MKFLYVLPLLLYAISCGTTKHYRLENFNSYQVPLLNQTKGNGMPGKCYAKMRSPEGELHYYEVICEQDINTSMIKLIETSLQSLDYNVAIDGQLSSEDKEALVDFQKAEGMAYGQIDQATLHRLMLRSDYQTEK